jgi:hypothetical protein
MAAALAGPPPLWLPEPFEPCPGIVKPPGSVAGLVAPDPPEEGEERPPLAEADTVVDEGSEWPMPMPARTAMRTRTVVTATVDAERDRRGGCH